MVLFIKVDGTINQRGVKSSKSTDQRWHRSLIFSLFGLAPSFLAASPLLVTQSLHSRIARTLLSQRKKKDYISPGA